VIDIRAPLHFQHAALVDPRRQNLGRRGDEQIDVSADPITPTSHWLDEEQPIDAGLE
jgi:hypothetical protein